MWGRGQAACVAVRGLGYLAFAAGAFALAGCLTVRDNDGTVHHIVLGAGVISVKEASNRAMVVTDSHVVGLHVSDQPGTKVGFGYSSSMVTSVSREAKDVRAEVSRKPGGSITIEVQNAELAEVVEVKDETSKAKGAGAQAPRKPGGAVAGEAQNTKLAEVVELGSETSGSP